MENLSLRAFDRFTHDVIVVDGLWGTGKQLVNSIVGAAALVEHYKYNADYDYFLALHWLGRLDVNATTTLLQLLEGRNQYYGLIGREINLRLHDESGLGSHPRRVEWVRRLVSSDGDAVAERIDRENIASNLMTHCISIARRPLSEAFGNRLRFIEVVRHPVHLVRHWSRFLGDKLWRRTREFNLAVDCSNVKVPWFASPFASEFSRSSVADRACLCVARLTSSILDGVESDTPGASLHVPFEQLVLDPGPSLKQIALFLSRDWTRRLEWVLRRNGVPRQRIADGPRIGPRYRWTSSGSDAEVYRRLADEIDAEVSAPVRDEF
ncbi:MAG: hypothetical protein RL340_62, partial [Gemmatimonadota bacterium]